MNKKVIDLKYGKLHLIKTKKFRSINIKVVLKDEIRKEEITKRNLLTDYLVISTNNYKTRKKLALKIQDLYSLSINSYNNRIGKYLVTRFNLSLLNPKYTEECMLLESIKLFHDVLFDPNLVNNKFDTAILNVLKNDLESEIKTVSENSKLYSNIRMLELLGEDVYSYHGYGYLEDLNDINEKNLYEYYKEFISKSDVDIYVIGDFNEKEIVPLIKKYLNFKTIKKPKKNIYLTQDKIRKKVNTVVEESSFNQSKLAIGCKIKDLNDFERKYVINLYNMILGGGFNSKFMQVIREKNSLAYYINSSVNKADNLLIINSGISEENFENVIKNIKKIMKSMQNGDITDKEIEDVKTEYLSILDETSDNMNSIVENEIATNLLDLDDFDIRRNEILKVTKEDIINVSKKIYLDTVYLLKGDSNEKIRVL